jgi:hypothetical protein
MQRLGVAFSLILSATTFACSDDPAGGDDGGGATGGSSTGGSATGGSSTGGSSTGGSAGSGTTGGSGGSATGGSTTGGSGGSAGSEMLRGLCEQRSVATVSTSDYMGTEEFFILTQEAYEDGRVDNPVPEDMVCRITFDVVRSGMAPAGCDDGEGMACPWTHEVTYENPRVLIDTSCADSEIGWDQAWIDEMDGSTIDYGYLYMYMGHGSVLLTYSETVNPPAWVELGGAYWNEETGEFTFRIPLGRCRY